ncbi:MAG: hypothetical protein O3A00_24880, partial [Planctomycetota bacterium]|nr:hypothetical protein [Planctomycetota bacterium]
VYRPPNLKSVSQTPFPPKCDNSNSGPANKTKTLAAAFGENCVQLTAMTEQPQQEDLAHADVGIVCALPIELKPFVARLDRVRKYKTGRFTFRGGRWDQIRVVVVESGMGFARARDATQSLIGSHSPNWILSCGFSGGLLPETKIGSIVMANRIVDTHGQELSVDLKMQSDAAKNMFVGGFVIADEMIKTVDEKRRLAEVHSAIAVDMESLAVAQICRDTETRFMSIRAISDDLSEDLPQEITTVIANSGSSRLGAAMGAIWKRPGSVKDMWRLRENAHVAADRLAAFLDGVIPQLA